MRYAFATLICAVAAILGAFVWFVAAMPPGEGSFGYAKALPIAVPYFGALLFGSGWFPALLCAFLHKRFASRPTEASSVVLPTIVLIVSAVAFVPSSHRLYSMWSTQRRMERLGWLAAQPSITLQDWTALIDTYCIDSEHGNWPDRGNGLVIRTLIRNRATPPEALGQLADGLNNGSYLLFEIAQHPNCPARLVERFRLIPLVVPYLARNPQASPGLLESLSLSSDPGVKLCVARNLRTPQTALERLAKDKDDMVRQFANDNLHGTLGDYAWR